MTTGIRIAQMRKENNLSQEALGEALGVSRQAISKWESDQSLPEVEKLVALSRLFGVSVGWLLGAEESPGPAEDGSASLSERQLRMVDEIAARYIAALPAQEAPKKRRNWVPAALSGIAMVLALTAVIHSTARQDDGQYQNLQQQINRLSNQVSGEISQQVMSLTARMEEILQAQDAIVADWDMTVVRRDFRAGTITFKLEAIPKTYTDGMTATFVTDSGDKTLRTEADYLGGAFTAEVTCPLTDRITHRVIFSAGGVQENQVLDTVEGYLTLSQLETFSNAGPLDQLLPGTADLSRQYGTIHFTRDSNAAYLGVLPVEARLGLFVNHVPAAWMETFEHQDDLLNGDIYETNFMRFPEGAAVELKTGDQVDIVLLIRDNFDRVYGQILESCTVPAKDYGGAPPPAGSETSATMIDAFPKWLQAYFAAYGA